MKSLRKSIASIATIVALGLGAGAAQAAIFNFDHDSADLVAGQASFTLAGINWGQEIGSTRINGALYGVLTAHGGVAGCARVVIDWKTASGSILDTDSATVCTDTSLPSQPLSVNRGDLSSQLRKATVKLYFKPANSTAFTLLTSRNAEAGGA